MATHTSLCERLFVLLGTFRRLIERHEPMALDNLGIVYLRLQPYPAPTLFMR
jgi:hypothetical protein